MIKTIIFSYFLFLSNSFASSSLPTLPEELTQISDVMIMQSSEPEHLLHNDNGHTGIGPCQYDHNNDKNTKSSSPGKLTLTAKKKWGLQVHFSTFSSDQKDNKKKYLTEQLSSENVSKIENIINTDYNSHEERKKAISDMCKGESARGILQYSAYLGARLSSIYDDGRLNDQSTVIDRNDHWNALKTGVPQGNCTDAAFTQTDLMMACGIKPENLKIHRYTTADAAHNVVTMIDEDGNLHALNWSEVYNTKDGGVYSKGPMPRIENTDIFTTVFDPVSGKVVSNGKTELGDILTRVSGGVPEKKHYIPELLRAELTYGRFGLNFFQSQTKTGDNTKGIAGYAKFGSLNDETYLSLGVAFAKNEKDYQVSETQTNKLSQNMVFLRMQTHYSPRFNVIEGENSTVYLKPIIGIEGEAFVSQNTIEGLRPEEGTQQGNQFSVTAGGTLGYESENLTAKVSVRTDYDRSSFANAVNTTDSAFYHSKSHYEAGIGWKGDRLELSANAESVISQVDEQHHYKLSASDIENGYTVTGIYSKYSRDGSGDQDSYVSIEGNKRWELRKADIDTRLILQTALGESKDKTAYFNIRYSPR